MGFSWYLTTLEAWVGRNHKYGMYPKADLDYANESIGTNLPVYIYSMDLIYIKLIPQVWENAPFITY